MAKSLSLDPKPLTFTHKLRQEMMQGKSQWLLVWDPRVGKPRVVSIIKEGNELWLEEENGRRYQWEYVPYTSLIVMD